MSCLCSQECLDLWGEKEILDEYNCVPCKRNVQATKNLTIHRLPLVLVLHLKRFNAEAEFIMTCDGPRAVLNKVLLVTCVEQTLMSHMLRDDSTCAMIWCSSSCLCRLLCMLC